MIEKGILNLMKKIVSMTFPIQDKNLGLEPSVLTVLPDGENVEYLLDYKNCPYSEDEVEYWLCSVYITGFKDFVEWSQNHVKAKIIAGGYEPTINPDKFIEYAGRIIVGPCDDFYETIKQNGQIVKGITNNKKIPRYDLYDIKLNQQIIPDKHPDDIVTSINTSQGCPFQCDFCCSPLMSDHIITKPIELVGKEVDYLKMYHPKFLFIRDENFPLQKDWKEKLKLINQTGAKIYLFASANLLTEETVKYMKDNGVYMICLGLEDITVQYNKNKKLDKACELLRQYGIYTYLSFIVDPTKIKTDYLKREFYKKLLERFYELKPEMVCGNFLMPFPGTKLWDKYKHLVSEDDYCFYNSKSAFLEKDLHRRSVDEFDMFKYQWIYYNSDFYNNEIRKFAVNDTLYLRFLELKEEFKRKRFVL